MNPEEKLAEGCKILESLLVPAGFQFISGQTGKSSGGYFASGAYVRNGRRLELHFRFSVFTIKGVRCRALICHEYRYPELYREYKRKGGAFR